MSSEKKDDYFFHELDELTPATFSSFQNPSYKALDSRAVFPTTNTSSSFSSFQDPEIYRSIEPASSLSQETYRAVDASSFSGGSDFFNGGFVIGNDFPSFSLDPKSQLSSQTSSSADGYSIVQKSKLALSEAVVQRVEPPLPPGGYLEPSYHVFSTANPTALIQSVLNVLHQQQVDCVAKHEQFKIKCSAYRSCARLSFYVHVFSAGEGSKRYAVEFQRRSGDALHFSEIYRSAKRSLAEQHLIEKVKASSIRPDLPAPPPIDMQITVDQVKDTVKALLLMVTSKYVDLKAQGMVALADLTTSDPKVQKMMVEGGALDAMVEELSCQSQDVQRCAVTGIANLAHEREQVCHKIYDAGAVKQLLVLAKSETPQVARECARLLANLGTTLGKKVVDSEFRATLKHIRGGRDSRAREYIAPLIELLGF
jgi:hypothetical protein